ncbi:hypothetical protein GALL_540060 [mine drainage metagenome]|uniref:Uncharacterized protein n=1 Tax=mine drainage metagenome TaxID=410659 RepID=A0A1J5PGQ2_9ZZZZ
MQNQIASLMTKGIVDLLESVEVDIQNGERSAPRKGAHARRIEQLMKMLAIGEPGQVVVLRQLTDEFLLLQALHGLGNQRANIRGEARQLGFALARQTAVELQYAMVATASVNSYTRHRKGIARLEPAFMGATVPQELRVAANIFNPSRLQRAPHVANQAVPRCQAGAGGVPDER